MFTEQFYDILPTLRAQNPEMFIVFYRGHPVTILKTEFAADPAGCISKLTTLINELGDHPECDSPAGVLSVN
jgi:hypothetical protein